MGDFSPKPGGRAGDKPVRIYAAGNTTGATTSGTARSLSLSAAGIASVGLSNGSILISASSAAQTAPTVSLYAVGNTTDSASSGVNQAGSISFDGAGIVSVGVSGSSVVISASSAAQTVQTIRGLAAGNTTGSSSSTTFDARSVTVSGAGDISVGYSSDNILIISGTAPVASGSVRNMFAFGNTTAQSSSTTATLTQLSMSGAGIVSIGFSTTGAGAGLVVVSATTAAQTVQTIGGVASGNTTGSSSSTTFDARSVTVSGAGIVSVGYSSDNILIVSATTAAQTVQTIGGRAAGNTTGSSSSTTFDARSVTVSGAGDISVGYSSNNILIISGSAPVASGTVVNMSAIGNTTAQSSSSTQTLTALSFSGAGGVSIGMSATAAGSPVLVISGATTVASGVVNNLFALGNTTAQSSSSTVTLTNLSFSGAGIVSVGLSTTGAGAGVVVLSATTAAQTVQTIGGLAAGNTTGSSSSTTFDARSVTVSGGGIVSVGYSSNNILIVSATSAASQGGLSFNAIGNTTGVTSSSASSLPETLTLSGAGGVSLGFSNSTIVISGATTAAQTAPTLSFSALGNTTALTTSFVDIDGALNFSGAGAASVGFSNSTIVVSVPTGVGTSTGVNSAIGNTTGLAASMSNTFSSQIFSGGGGVSVGFSNGTMVISDNNTSNFFAIGANTAIAGTTTSMTAANTLSVSGKNDIDVAFNAGTMVVANELVSYFEPRPHFGANVTFTLVTGTMMVAPLIVNNAMSFNQVRIHVSRTSGAGSLTCSSAAGASATATASAGWNSTVSFVIYSRQGGTSSQSFTTFASTTLTYGMTQSWSISRTAGSNTASATLSFGYGIGTSAGLTSTFTITSSNAGTTIYSIAFTAASLFTNSTTNLMRMDIPFATSLGNGAYLVGIMGSSATATATGNSLNTLTAGNWSQSMLANTLAVTNTGPIFVPGVASAAGAGNYVPGLGSTSSAGNAVPGTIAWQSLSYAASNPMIYLQFGQL